MPVRTAPVGKTRSWWPDRSADGRVGRGSHTTGRGEGRWFARPVGLEGPTVAAGDTTDERWSSRLGFLLATVGAAVVAGLVIFPIVFGLGLEPTLGTELAFTTLPTAFATMPSGRVVAVGFFGLILFAAPSSAVSLLEVGVAAATNTTRLGRRRATLLLTAGVFALGVPSALSYSPVRLAVAGRPVLDLIDESVGTFALPISALLVLLVSVWRADLDGVGEALGPLRPLVRYLVPVVLVLVLVTAARASGIARPAWRLLVGRARDGPGDLLLVLAVLLVFAALGW
jgi:NSS family neurotransmitter:Na+ symporter